MTFQISIYEVSFIFAKLYNDSLNYIFLFHIMIPLHLPSPPVRHPLCSFLLHGMLLRFFSTNAG
jgi:hypothetical protein